MTTRAQSKDTAVRTESGHAPILIGHDESDGGRDAVELARLLGEVQHQSCAIATIFRVPISVGEVNSGEMTVELEPLFSETRAALGDPEAETHIIGAHSPARMLVECAEREGSETIVLGSPRHSGLSKALLGSTSERVLHHAPCEVAIAPLGYASETHPGLTRIAVAYDGTKQGKAALVRARALALQSGAEIEILVADDPVVRGLEESRPASPPRSASSVLRGAIESVGKEVQVSGQVLEGVWRQGEDLIAQAISQACEHDVDLLLTGSRRHGPIDRMILGSVTNSLVRNAPCPIMVVPHQ